MTRQQFRLGFSDFGELTFEGLGNASMKGTSGLAQQGAVIEGGLHPDFAIANLNWTDRHVVRPQVECATAFEIEAGVMPMTCQNAVFNAAALERKTHVGAPIVQGENAPSIVDDEDWTMVTVHDQAPLRFELLKATREHEFVVRYVHEHTSAAFFGLK